MSMFDLDRALVQTITERERILRELSSARPDGKHEIRRRYLRRLMFLDEQQLRQLAAVKQRRAEILST